MIEAVLFDPRFHELLVGIDREIADAERRRGCVCGGPLHRADYLRKPRGLAPGVATAHTRFSFCCAHEGCRRRVTPPSLRLLGRRSYLATVVVLASALKQGPSARRAKMLRERLGVGLRTLARWQSWWHEVFPRTIFWRFERAGFVPPCDASRLPDSLMRSFNGPPLVKLLYTLLFLRPLTDPELMRVVRNPQKLSVLRV